METSRWERTAAASGIVFLILVGLALIVVPTSPRLSQTNELVRYTTENRTGLLWQAYLGIGAIGFLLWFAGSIRTHLRRNEGESGRLAAVSFGGAVASAAMMLFGIASFAASAFRPGDAARVQMLNDIGTVAMVYAWIPAAVWAGATAIASLRSRALPMWHAVLGGIVALAGAVTPALMFREQGFFSIDEPFGAWALTYGIFGIWVFATSMLLILGEAAKVEEVAQPHAEWHLRRAAGH